MEHLTGTRIRREATPATVNLRRCKLVVIKGAGHVSNLERPEQFNQAVREFCRAHSHRADGSRP